MPHCGTGFRRNLLDIRKLLVVRMVAFPAGDFFKEGYFHES